MGKKIEFGWLDAVVISKKESISEKKERPSLITHGQPLSLAIIPSALSIIN